MPIFFALLQLAAMPNVASETDILAQLRAGKMLCSNPDPATKTCSTIDSYAARDDGTFIDTGEVLFSPDQPVTLETSSIAHIEHGAICGTMDVGDLQRGKVRVNGTPLAADRNTLVVNKVIEKLKPMAGRKVCEGLRIEAGRLLKFAQMERLDINLPGEPVLWITVGDGYRVAPH